VRDYQLKNGYEEENMPTSGEQTNGKVDRILLGERVVRGLQESSRQQLH
jgi:hypothetical protein